MDLVPLWSLQRLDQAGATIEVTSTQVDRVKEEFIRGMQSSEDTAVHIDEADRSK